VSDRTGQEERSSDNGRSSAVGSETDERDAGSADLSPIKRRRSLRTWIASLGRSHGRSPYDVNTVASSDDLTHAPGAGGLTGMDVDDELLVDRVTDAGQEPIDAPSWPEDDS